MARASTTSDVFNAVADMHRREDLERADGRREGGRGHRERALDVPPQVSKHLRVLSEVGLVNCRAEGRRRLYCLEPARLRPLREWLAKYEQAVNDRLGRLDDYLQELQQQGDQHET